MSGKKSAQTASTYHEAHRAISSYAPFWIPPPPMSPSSPKPATSPPRQHLLFWRQPQQAVVYNFSLPPLTLHAFLAAMPPYTIR
ncbi:MAG: hypothetical protein H6668_19840 [Ardenticatenaceae bacterium]|nr:hypothetical protein [Ardenticatenaceae bacterium]